MKRWLLRIAVVLSALAVAASGSWYVWREFWSAEQFRAAVAEGIEKGDFTRVEGLKAWGADTDEWRREDSGKQLFDAIQERRKEVAVHLLALGADANWRYEGNFTPLIWAARFKDTEMAKVLVDANVDLNVANENGIVPIHWATNNNDYEMTKLLLETGADANVNGSYGWTALHWAASVRNTRLCRLLLQYGASPYKQEETAGHPPSYWFPELTQIVKEVEAEKAGAKP